jgi:predicted Zn-dependent peptidase
MMNEGTTNYTTEQISAEIEKLGSTINFGSNEESTVITVTCLTKIGCNGKAA